MVNAHDYKERMYWATPNSTYPLEFTFSTLPFDILANSIVRVLSSLFAEAHWQRKKTENPR